ncbi:MAG TPA: hypothetical protein VF294_06375 [Polyangiaceae bacterium]
MSQLRPLLTCMLLSACPIFACSVINKYDDVVPAKTAEGGTSAGGTSAGGLASGGLDEMAGEAGTTTTGGTNSGGAGGSSPVPTHGLLAVAGTDPTKLDGSVVALIDPTTGIELARQTITGGAAVAGLAYDGATGKDVWYEFTAGTFPADPTSVAALQVFRFTDAGAGWKAVSSKQTVGLPPPRPNTFVVLNDRLAYLSYTIVAGAPVDSLTVLDTTDPTAVKQIKLTSLTLPTGVGVEVLGMVGTRGVLGDETAPGGTLALMIGNACSGKHLLRACGKIQLLPVTVSDDASAGVAVDLSPTLIGEPGFASAQSTQLGYVAFTPGLNKTVSLKYFDPRKLATINSGAPPYAAHWLGGLAYAECQDVGLFTAVADKTLYSSSSAGLSDDVPLAHNGQNLVYEPFTGHIITLFNPDNAVFADAPATSGDGGAGGSDNGMPALGSFDVTTGAVLSRTAVAKWNPPKNLAPNIAVARFPLSYVCK